MNPEFESRNNSRQNSSGDSPDTSPGALDTQKRDRFELLSAYLDGEVSAAERRQVEDWLESDPQMQCLYNRLLQLRQGLKAMPMASSGRPVEETVQQVFSRLDRRRRKPVLVWGGTAIAAMFVAAVSGAVGNLSYMNSWSPQIAQSPQSREANDALTIALNEPVVQLPSASAPSSMKYHKHPASHPHTIK